MPRTVFFLITFWGYLILIIPSLLLAGLCKALGNHKASRKLGNYHAHQWGSLLMKLARSRITVHGEANLGKDQGALFVGNHQGAFDIPILLASLGTPIGFVAKIELSKIPLVSAWMRHIGCAFIDRSDRRQSLTVMKAAMEDLKTGTSLVIYPEGTRSDSDDIAPFKKGSIAMAVKAGVPIVPFTIRDSWKIRQKGSKIIQPAKIDLFLHERIDTAQLSPEEKDGLIDTIFRTVVDKLHPEAREKALQLLENTPE